MNNNIKICFPNENTFGLISELLENSGIKEGLEESLFKKKSFIDIIYKLSEDFALEKISQKDFISSLQKELGTSAKISENIVIDVQKKILPLAEKVEINHQSQKQKLNEYKTYSEETKEKKKTEPNQSVGRPQISLIERKKDEYREPVE